MQFLGSFVFDWFGSWVIKALKSLSLKDIDDRVFVVSRRSSLGGFVSRRQLLPVPGGGGAFIVWGFRTDFWLGEASIKYHYWSYGVLSYTSWQSAIVR